MGLLRRRRKTRAVPPAAENPYDGLRDRFLALGAEPGDDLLRGAAFEMGTGGACASVICVADGTTSLYLSTGGGQIGLGQHEPVRRANAAFRAAVTAHLELMRPVPEVPHVAQDEVHVVAVTSAGLRLLRWREDEISEAAPDWPLYLAGQDVVTQIRLLDEINHGRKTY